MSKGGQPGKGKDLGEEWGHNPNMKIQSPNVVNLWQFQ